MLSLRITYIHGPGLCISLYFSSCPPSTLSRSPAKPTTNLNVQVKSAFRVSPRLWGERESAVNLF